VLALHSHKPPILHRDLKSPNLLIDKHWRCKIADFNLSRVMVRAAARPVCALSCPVAQAGLPPISTNKPRCRSGAGHVQPLGALLGIPWSRAPPVDHVRSGAAGGERGACAAAQDSPVVSSVAANNPRWLAPEVILHQARARPGDVLSHTRAAHAYSFAILKRCRAAAVPHCHCAGGPLSLYPARVRV